MRGKRKRIRVRKHKRRTRKSGPIIVKSHLRSIRLKRPRPLFIDKNKEVCNPEDIIKNCRRCKAELNWEGFKSANKRLNKDFLRRLWLSLDTQFFCCDCHQKLSKIPQTKLLKLGYKDELGLREALEALISEADERAEIEPSSPYRSYHPNLLWQKEVHPHIELNETETRIIDKVLKELNLDKTNNTYRGLVKAYGDNFLEIQGYFWNNYEREWIHKETGKRYPGFTSDDRFKGILNRDMIWISPDSLTGYELLNAMMKIVPDYNYFESEKHLARLIDLLPENTRYFPGRYSHPVLIARIPEYDFSSISDEQLKIYIEQIQSKTKASEILVDNAGNIEFWW